MGLKVITDPIDKKKILSSFDKKAEALMEDLGEDMVARLKKDMGDVIGIFPEAIIESKVTVTGLGKARVWFNVAKSDEFNFVEGGTSGSTFRKGSFLLQVREPRTKVRSLKVKPKQPVKAELWIPTIYTLRGTEARQWFRTALDELKKKYDKKDVRGVELRIKNYRIQRAKV